VYGNFWHFGKAGASDVSERRFGFVLAVDQKSRASLIRLDAIGRLD
jgi:hypothetical protein